MPSSYDLLTENWIPVIWTDGRHSRIGIRTALAEAHAIRQIAASNPMDNVAVFRFLLAILYWCEGIPPADDEKASLLRAGGFPSGWFAKLDREKQCFDLFGEELRFFQYRGATREGKVQLTVNYLMQEVPTGRNSWHFRHSTDHENGLCPACCALGLIRLPLFATSGGRGKPPGINSKPPIYIVPVGSTLHETLVLNWLPQSDLGNPAWQEACFLKIRENAVPLLVGLTWLPRMVWLDEPVPVEAICIACGRTCSKLIRSCVFDGIGSVRTEDDGRERNWIDPHVIYTRDKNGSISSTHASDALGAADGCLATTIFPV